MSYVDAAYAICLSVLFLYGASLVARRRRLERVQRQAGAGAGGEPAGPAPVETVTVETVTGDAAGTTVR